MNLKKLFTTPLEGVIEIEESQVRFLVPDGKSYKTTTVPVVQTDVLTVLRQNLAKFMGEVRQVSVVTNYQTGVKVLPFPPGMQTHDIIEHLQLKREEYFGVKGECDFMLRTTDSKSKDSNDILVSYILKSFLQRLQQICLEEGFSLVRVVNFVEAMIGAYRLQAKGKSQELVCLLSIGYYSISMVVLRQGQPIAVRTSLTGSVKEIENRLMSVLKLNKGEVSDLLAGRSDAGQESIELLQQNERELLSRILPFFAYIRSLGANTKDLEIYLTMPYISLPGMKSLLEKNFQAKVSQLDSGNKKKIIQTDTSADLDWLLGAFSQGLNSFTTIRTPFFRFVVTRRTAWMFIILFLVAPLGLARVNSQLLQGRLEALQNRHAAVESLYRQSQKNIERFDRLSELGKLIEHELSGRSPFTPLIRNVVATLGDEVRLESLNINRQARRIAISGVAIDNETALRLWDVLDQSAGLKNVRINFSGRHNEHFPKFTVAAELEMN